MHICLVVLPCGVLLHLCVLCISLWRINTIRTIRYFQHIRAAQFYRRWLWQAHRRRKYDWLLPWSAANTLRSILHYLSYALSTNKLQVDEMCVRLVWQTYDFTILHFVYTTNTEHCEKLDCTRHSAHLRHASLNSAQCRCRWVAGASTQIFPHCAVTGFPTNFTFTFRVNWLLDYLTNPWILWKSHHEFLSCPNKQTDGQTTGEISMPRQHRRRKQTRELENLTARQSRTESVAFRLVNQLIYLLT